jgi:hypothetical protein
VSYFTKELVSRLFSSLAVPFTGSELLRLPALGILTAWLFAALLVDAVWRASTDRRFAVRVARCTVWVLVPALPAWSAFSVSADLQGSRYLYLPACGWSVLMATLLLERRTRAGRDVGVAVTAVLLFAWCLGVRSHLRDWQEAALVRDRVLESAVSRLQHSPCTVVGFTRVPDSIRGAYVFRNGFLEALERRGTLRAKATIGDSDEAGCTLRWQDPVFR